MATKKTLTPDFVGDKVEDGYQVTCSDEVAPHMVTTITRLNVRLKPSRDSAVVRELPAGTRVEVIGECGEWYEIDGGFIMVRFVE